MIYYDGTKLLNTKDLNGKQPEIYIVTSNRTAGKTTYFNRLAINRFKKSGKKFCLLYRFNYELDDVTEKFFKDINTLFFPNDNLEQIKKARGKIIELFLNKKSCGYAIALNDADAIKKYSHYLSDVELIIFDEFQSETNHYCDNEIRKFQSVHLSIARGKNKMVRYVPVIMISNPVTLLNPYYVKMNIASRLKSNTKFLRGDGYVLEQNLNENARNAQKESAFNRAFSQDKYISYASDALYLNDNSAFIEKMRGQNTYICTFKYNNSLFAIREYAEQNIIYVSDIIDKTYPIKISVTTEDHEINYVLLRKNQTFIFNLRYFFEHGCFRFKNLNCKDALINLISY